MSKLEVSYMTVQKLKKKQPHAKKPHVLPSVEELLAKKPLIVLLSSLSGNFFPEKSW